MGTTPGSRETDRRVFVRPRRWGAVGGVGLLLLVGLAATIGGARADPFAIAGSIAFWMLSLVALVLFRRGTTVDRSAGTVAEWVRIGLRFTLRRHRLSAFDTVVVGWKGIQDRRKSETRSARRVVALRGRHGTRIDLQAVRDEQEGLALGRELAEWLGLRLVDLSLGHAIVREPEQLGETLRHRAARSTAPPTVPEPPAGARSTVTAIGDALVIEVHAPGFRAVGFAHLAGLSLLPALIVGSMVFQFLQSPGLTPRTKVVILVAAVLLLVVAPVVVVGGRWLREARRRVTVTVSPSELRVEARGPLLHRTTAIPADRLEHLAVIRHRRLAARLRRFGAGPAGHLIVARSAAESVTFGTGLSLAELQWLRAVIEAVVTAG